MLAFPPFLKLPVNPNCHGPPIPPVTEVPLHQATEKDTTRKTTPDAACLRPLPTQNDHSPVALGHGHHTNMSGRAPRRLQPAPSAAAWCATIKVNVGCEKAWKEVSDSGWAGGRVLDRRPDSPGPAKLQRKTARRATKKESSAPASQNNRDAYERGQDGEKPRGRFSFRGQRGRANLLRAGCEGRSAEHHLHALHRKALVRSRSAKSPRRTK